MLHSYIPTYSIDIYIIYMAESSCGFHFPQTMGQV